LKNPAYKDWIKHRFTPAFLGKRRTTRSGQKRSYTEPDVDYVRSVNSKDLHLYKLMRKKWAGKIVPMLSLEPYQSDDEDDDEHDTNNVTSSTKLRR